MAVLKIRHLGLKVVSVILASLLWLLVSGEQTVERALRIPLEFTNLPPQLELVGEPLAVVDVRLRGSSGTMSRMSAGDLAAVLDVRTAKPGPRLFNLTTADVRAPFGVEVVQVTPASVSLAFEESTSKTVPVTARVEGEPEPGFVVSGIMVEPASVVVVGPASALTGLSEAITEPVSVSGATGGLTENVTIGVAEPSVRLREAQSARVTVMITPAPQEWVVDGIPVQVRGGKAVAAVVPSTVAVHVRGTRASNDSAGRYTASVDAAGLGSGRHVLPVRIDAPSGLGVLRVDPAAVTITIR